MPKTPRKKTQQEADPWADMFSTIGAVLGVGVRCYVLFFVGVLYVVGWLIVAGLWLLVAGGLWSEK